mgnify:CR=1 FL=1
MPSSNLLVFDCGAAHLSGGVFTVEKDGGLRLESHASEELLANSSDEKSWGSALGEAVTRVMSRVNYEGSECVITVPGHLALTKFVKTPAVEHSKRDRIVQFEASQNIPYPLNEVAWDYAEVADDGVDVELMLSAVKRDALDELCAVFKQAGLVVTGIEPGGLAAIRAWRTAPGRIQDSSLVVDVGAKSTQLLFVGRDNFFMRTLPFGGNLATQLLAKKLSCELTEAESLKRELSEGGRANDSGRQALIDEAVMEFTSRLQAELTRSIFSYSRHTEAETPEEIVLMGGESRLPDLRRRIAESTALSTRSLDVIADLELRRANGDEAGDDSLLALAGLAQSHFANEGVAMNLLPVERQAEQGALRARPWWLAAVALLILALQPPIIYLQLTASRHVERSQVLHAELGPLIMWDARNRKNLEQIESLRERLGMLSEIEQRSERWTSFLADMQSRLESVGDVWLESMIILPISPLSSDTEEGAPLRLGLSGKLLDIENPTTKASSASRERVNQLLQSFGESKYVQDISAGGFDKSQPGILKFELTIVINEEEAL